MIPVASGLTSVVTASILDGSTNAFLALRVGIITRCYFNFRADRNTPGYRRAVLKEAAGMLLSVAMDSTRIITGAYLKTITRSAGEKAATAARKVVDTTDRAFEATGRAARFSAEQVGKVARFARFKSENKVQDIPPPASDPNPEPESESESESVTREAKNKLNKIKNMFTKK